MAQQAVAQQVRLVLKLDETLIALLYCPTRPMRSKPSDRGCKFEDVFSDYKDVGRESLPLTSYSLCSDMETTVQGWMLHPCALLSDVG
jgi:hypothetical protein